ncbi:peptidoglycan DD-metalloendopeptidase family protein [Aliikangiella sp. IMCC44359]|uniref:peptidoglycan DD-metalloendopeptidase family protein n=1 Tax=Aliikangiella sp. IMCC44359 TaxID=3459125 RepID=UPI00403ABBE2
MKIVQRKITTIVIVSLLYGCSYNAPAPVIDLYARSNQSQVLSKPDSTPLQKAAELKDFHIVKPGETLFSIAWYYALEHEKLAEINQIKNNLIFPGQKLLLKHIGNQPIFNPESLIAALNEEILQTPVRYDFEVGKVEKPQIQQKKQSRIKVSSRSRYKKNNKHSQTQKTKEVKVASVSKAKSYSQKNKVQPVRLNKDQTISWIWPTDGRILDRFSSSSNANRGLDIAAARGQPVRATASGRVVYEGNGLRGYGNLVIIKHDNNYLSAYAHNQKIHVSENEFVNAGQRIADVGSSGTHIDKLHFEIRYKGKPVDPLNYLPKKNY